MAHAIGLDIGTTNVKAALVDPEGRLVAATARPLATTLVDDTAEQDPESIWSAVVDAVAELTAAHPSAARDIAVVGLASQYSSTIPIDSAGAPVGPCILYLDHRGTDHSHAIFGTHADAFATWVERHGIPPVGGGLSLAHILHFQRDRPEIHKRTTAYVEVMDYIAARLTGRVAATQSTMFTTQLCDNRTIGVTKYDDDLVRMSGVDPTRLPPLAEPGAVHGGLRGDAAAELGVPIQTMLATPMNDSQAGAYATDAFADGTVGVMIGTTAVILDTVATMQADYEQELLTMPTPDPGRYLVWAENGLAGRVVEHVLEQFLFVDDGDPFAHLEPMLTASEPGAGGALFLPWFSGSMSPAVDHAMRGGFVGASLTTTRNDLVRAAIEGTAHNLAWLLGAVERFSGSTTELIAFGGGAARSSAWAQILADILDRPVRPLEDPSYAVARTLGAIALGRVGRPVQLIARFADHEFSPNPATRAMYALHQHRFESTFNALQPIWKHR